MKFKSHADAVEWAEVKVREMADTSALARGAGDYEISVTVHSESVDVSGTPEDSNPSGSLFLETVVMGRAIGKINPGLKAQKEKKK